MPAGGWEDLGKACPNKSCNGVLFAKGLNGTHLAVRCSRKDYEKRGREDEMLKFIRKLKRHSGAEYQEDED